LIKAFVRMIVLNEETIKEGRTQAWHAHKFMRRYARSRFRSPYPSFLQLL
jgi:hypothetical protein